MTEALAIFTRTPVLGRVKTRLQAELGAAGALAVHRRLAEETFVRMANCTADISLWVTEHSDETQDWHEQTGWPVHLQRGSDLGERMHHVLDHLLSAGAERACLIGTDCPTLDAAYVANGFAALRRGDVVVGPAEDGGYGLIGVRRSLPELFDDMPWGTDAVLKETRSRCEARGLSCVYLDVVWDVDEPGDWERYLASLDA